MKKRKRNTLSPPQIDLLTRASSIEGDEGVLVESGGAISAQALRRRGLVKLVNQRSSGNAAGYLVFITPDGTEELARHEKQGTKHHVNCAMPEGLSS